MEVEPTLIQEIPIKYESEDYNISFLIKFGKGKDSDDFPNSFERVNFNTQYNIEAFNVNDTNMYRLLSEEGPFVLNVKNINIIPKNGVYEEKTYGGTYKYNYGIRVVVDFNKEPKYNDDSIIPENDIERDGNPWFVKNGQELKVDQNGNAIYQWSTAKALEKGVKPTPEQELMGVEERHENSGMVYITFQAVYTREFIEDPPEEYELTRGISRGITRGGGGVTRGITRGGGNDEPLYRGIGGPTRSAAARVGYGSMAKTNSVSVKSIVIPNSRYILPIRLRIIESTTRPIKCAKNLESAARVEELQKKTATIPDFD